MSKILTLSFDDGTIYDRRFIEILNNYGIKCTFNLNSDEFGKDGFNFAWGSYSVWYERINQDEVRKLYKGHEVASHSLHHPALDKLPDEEVIREVEEDRKNLSLLAGYEVTGFAYPGGPLYNQHTIDVMKNNTKIEYARNIQDTHGFDFPKENEWFEWKPTIFHGDESLFTKVQEFIDLEIEDDKDALLYIWGHAYEYEAWGTWNNAEKLCKMISNKNDILYMTNIEAKRYIQNKRGIK